MKRGLLVALALVIGLPHAASYGGTVGALAGIQTAVNEAGAVPGANSSPWMTPGINNVTTTGMDLALEQAEAAGAGAGSITANETIVVEITK